jgi:hypothetical protein
MSTVRFLGSLSACLGLLLQSGSALAQVNGTSDDSINWLQVVIGAVGGAALTGVFTVIHTLVQTSSERRALKAGLLAEIDAGLTRLARADSLNALQIIFIVNNELPYAYYKQNVGKIGLLGPVAAKLVVTYHTHLWSAYTMAEKVQGDVNQDKSSEEVERIASLLREDYMKEIRKIGVAAIEALSRRFYSRWCIGRRRGILSECYVRNRRNEK